MDTERERQCADLKAKLMQAYQQYHPGQSSVIKQERYAMRTLKERNIVIKCSQKSKSQVAPNIDTYVMNSEAI